MTERSKQRTYRTSVSFGRFLVEVLAVAALLAGGIYAYRGHVVKKERKGTLLSEARQQLRQHDFASLLAAERSLLEVVELDQAHPAALANLAETNVWLHIYGLETLQKAEHFLARAARAGDESTDRLAAEAYLAIARGQWQEAETELRSLLERGIAAAKLAHALGWALLEQGQFPEASRILTQAQDADFSSIVVPLALADLAERLGHERSAIGHLRHVVRDNMNPNHAWAQAWLAALLAKNHGQIREPAQHIAQLRDRLRRFEAENSATDNRLALSPRNIAMLEWAEGELALVLGNPQGALEKADQALTKLPLHPSIEALRARAMVATQQAEAGLRILSELRTSAPTHRGVHLLHAEILSDRGDDGALAIIDELEASHRGPKGPEYAIFRGEHHFRKGRLAEAKAVFLRAEEFRDEPAILLGLSKVAFEEEKKRGGRADLSRVEETFQRSLEHRASYPEAYEFLGMISLWNLALEAADEAFQTAESQYKRQNVSIPRLIAFYDRAAGAFDRFSGPRNQKRRSSQIATAWKARKSLYVETLLSEG